MSTPRLHDGMRLVSTRSAITCAGLFVVSTLTKWEATSILRSAVIEAEELVTAAVGRTGIPGERMYWAELTRIEYITIQIYGFDTSVRIEVWDSAPNPPVLLEEAGSPIQRGCYPVPRGKVVWSELPLLPQRYTPSHPPQPASEQFVQDDPDFLRRVRDGLENL